MRSRLLALGFLPLAALALVACSNEVVISTGGGGGSDTTGSTGSKSASIATVGSSVSTGGGVCTVPTDCPAPQDACLEAVCVNGSCGTNQVPDGVSCEDGLFCTGGDTCHAGVCQGGMTTVCPGSGGCTIGVCDETAQACAIAPAPEGSACDDLDACTQDGMCTNGMCAKGPPTDCSAFNTTCSVGACGPMGCYPKPINEGAGCNDNQGCSISDHCQMGFCVGTPKQCPTSIPCQVGACDAQTGSCVFSTAPDGIACTVPGSCSLGMTCLTGTCQGGFGAPLYFYDDFHDNTQGWQLGQEWQIGPATVSAGQQFGNPDPGVDITSTSDNGIAGIVIGGNASITPHPFRYLQSPPINTANAPGQVVLRYWRWLNSDFQAWMHNTVDVWNGTQWINLYSSVGDASDAAWSQVQHDLTPYKNAQMKIRFGMEIPIDGAWAVSSWNVDDVRVSDPMCP